MWPRATWQLSGMCPNGIGLVLNPIWHATFRADTQSRVAGDGWGKGEEDVCKLFLYSCALHAGGYFIYGHFANTRLIYGSERESVYFVLCCACWRTTSLGILCTRVHILVLLDVTRHWVRSVYICFINLFRKHHHCLKSSHGSHCLRLAWHSYRA